MIAGDIAGFVYLYGGLVAVVVAVLLSPSSGGSWLYEGSYGPRRPRRLTARRVRPRRLTAPPEGGAVVVHVIPCSRGRRGR
ncbi:hypothetical protein [Nonomuraea dietziae]|uniref:hypothetical protein n=1 Tax=Nonomuraea dietziae TaxID=65515 RepID=UPI0031E4175E